MKKLFITLALVLALSVCGAAKEYPQFGNGGLFQRGEKVEKTSEKVPGFPGHGGTGNQNAPVGSGIAVLTTLGAAYLLGKKRNENK